MAKSGAGNLYGTLRLAEKDIIISFAACSYYKTPTGSSWIVPACPPHLAIGTAQISSLKTPELGTVRLHYSAHPFLPTLFTSRFG